MKETKKRARMHVIVLHDFTEKRWICRLFSTEETKKNIKRMDKDLDLCFLKLGLVLKLVNKCLKSSFLSVINLTLTYLRIYFGDVTYFQRVVIRITEVQRLYYGGNTPHQLNIFVICQDFCQQC